MLSLLILQEHPGVIAKLGADNQPRVTVTAASLLSSFLPLGRKQRVKADPLKGLPSCDPSGAGPVVAIDDHHRWCWCSPHSTRVTSCFPIRHFSFSDVSSEPLTLEPGRAAHLSVWLALWYQTFPAGLPAASKMYLLLH